MLITYWCCSRGKVYPAVQEQLFHSQVLLFHHCCCRTTAAFQWGDVSHVRRRVSSCATFSHVFPTGVAFEVSLLAPELIWRALKHAPASALSCDISPQCAFQQPADVHTTNRTQMTLRVPLETRCSGISKDPFHTSAARQRDVRTKGKVEE